MLPATLTFFGFTVHLYGLILGSAVIVSSELLVRKFRAYGFSENCFWNLAVLSLSSGIIGARAWHVMTDFQLYSSELMGIIRIWDGGLSILGGVLGGVLGAMVGLSFFTKCNQLNLKTVLDLSIFGLPVGQFIGRLGNYVNQELYGLPTEGFFKIYIEERHRFPDYQDLAFYHPLFFYEMIVTGVFVLGLYIIYKVDKKRLKVGSGNLFLAYVLYYSVWRILLDFLRIDRGLVWNGLGFNQMALLLIVLVVSMMLVQSKRSQKE